MKQVHNSIEMVAKEPYRQESVMNTQVFQNYTKLKQSLFILPICLLVGIVVFLSIEGSLSVTRYIEIQKSSFYFLNAKLSQFPATEYNLTQFGDTLIFLSLLSGFIVYAPKIWECLISASLVSVVLSALPKRFFAVPRPAAVFNNDSFVIIGKALHGGTSLPSGHSITVFATITVFLYGFMPRKLQYKAMWLLLLLSGGLILSFTRVGVGAHYPLDVITGSIIGYISGLSGIFITRKYKIWNWINSKDYYPVLIMLILTCAIAIIDKIIYEKLLIYYLTLMSLAFSLYKLISSYVKR